MGATLPGWLERRSGQDIDTAQTDSRADLLITKSWVEDQYLVLTDRTDKLFGAKMTEICPGLTLLWS